MSTFTLAISCLTTSNLPWFMDLTFQVPVQYCSLQHQTLLLSPAIHNWVLFFLWLHLFILSGVISPLISSSILGSYQPGELIFQCPIFLPFYTVHGVLKARMLKWFAIPFSSGPHFVSHLGKAEIDRNKSGQVLAIQKLCSIQVTGELLTSTYRFMIFFLCLSSDF